MYISRRTIWMLHLMIVPAFICLKLRDWYPDFATGWFIVLMSIVLPTIVYCVWYDEKEERERNMQWFFLTYDEEKDTWAERPKMDSEVPKEVQLQEYVWRYDGAILGADVKADNLDDAIAKAKEMVKKCNV